MNAFIFDLRRVKFECIQAYFHFQLLEAQKMTDEGNGRICTTETAHDDLRALLKDIVATIEKNGNTYEDMKVKSKFAPFIGAYYNVTGEVVKKHFKAGAGWIPSFLTLEVLRQFAEKGYKDFEHVDFMSAMALYEDNDFRKSNNLITHYKCAEEIVKTIDEKKVFKKKRKTK